MGKGRPPATRPSSILSKERGEKMWWKKRPEDKTKWKANVVRERSLAFHFAWVTGRPPFLYSFKRGERRKGGGKREAPGHSKVKSESCARRKFYFSLCLGRRPPGLLLFFYKREENKCDENEDPRTKQSEKWKLYQKGVLLFTLLGSPAGRLSSIL